MQPDHSNYWKWNNKELRFDVFASNDFSHLENVKQVYTLVLSKDKTQVLVVKNKTGMWMLPGGGVEEGESLMNTLVREVKEETNRDVDISTVKPLFYQKVYIKDGLGGWKFNRTEVRYSVVVKNDLEFISDPDNGDTVEVKWVEISNLEKYLDWGKTVEMIKNLLKINVN